MMIRIKWLLIGFVAGAATCGAATKWGCCSPDWMKMGGGECFCADDDAVSGAADAPASAATADEGPAA